MTLTNISTEDSSINENGNTFTETTIENSSSDPESNAKTKVCRSSTMPKTKPKPINWIKLLKIIYKQRSNGH